MKQKLTPGELEKNVHAFMNYAPYVLLVVSGAMLLVVTHLPHSGTAHLFGPN